MSSVTDDHSLFAPSSTPSTMAVDYSQVAGPCGPAMSGAYLVSLCAHLAGEPEDGVRDSLSAGSHSGTMRSARHAHPDFAPFGYSSSIAGETSVSCSIFTTVQTRVHITFPIPFTLAIFPVLAPEIGTDSRQPCVLAHRSFNHSFALPDCSRCTYGQGRAVPSVVLVKQDTESGWLPDQKLRVQRDL